MLVGVLALHFGYVAYLVVGGFVGWRWPKAFWPHLAAIVWGMLIVLGWVACPLTAAENWTRQRLGEAVPTTGLIDRYLTIVIYPARYLTEVRFAVAVVVAVAWAGVLVNWRRRTSNRGTGPSAATN